MNIKEKAYIEKIENGLTIIIIPKENTKKKYVIWGTHFGSIDNRFIMPKTEEEVFVPDGVAHFLEHKMFEQKDEKDRENNRSLTFREIFTIKGAIACFLTFFCYCSLELTTSLWASSYLVQKWSFTPDAAAGFASMFYLGVTFGRFANGFLAMKFK